MTLLEDRRLLVSQMQIKFSAYMEKNKELDILKEEIEIYGVECPYHLLEHAEDLNREISSAKEELEISKKQLKAFDEIAAAEK